MMANATAWKEWKRYAIGDAEAMLTLLEQARKMIPYVRWALSQREQSSSKDEWTWIEEVQRALTATDDEVKHE